MSVLEIKFREIYSQIYVPDKWTSKSNEMKHWFIAVQFNDLIF